MKTSCRGHKWQIDKGCWCGHGHLRCKRCGKAKSKKGKILDIQRT